MEIIKKKFHYRGNTTGSLTFLEGERDIPFPIKRIYYIYDIMAGERRGFHAHRELMQYLICISGSCKVLMDDGTKSEEIMLNDPNQGLYIGPKVWHEMFDFSENAVLLVLASDYYEENDYIRDYNVFMALVGGKAE